MSRTFNPWVLMLLAGAGAVTIYVVLTWGRWGRDPALAELLLRFPVRDAVTIHVDVAAVRTAGMGELLADSVVAEEPEYRRFVTESGFDWKTHLDAVTAARVGDDWYLFVRGRFDLEKLRNFALSRNGTCTNGVCSVAGATPGRWVSFYPLTPRVIALATSRNKGTVYNLVKKGDVPWVGGVPEGLAWVSFNGGVLEGDPALPAGGRLFGKVLSQAPRTTFAVSPGSGALELRMRSHNLDAAAAQNSKSQLEGVTSEFRKYFHRLGQTASPADLSGLLLSGKFAVTGNEVTGSWPLPPEFLKKLASGEL